MKTNHLRKVIYSIENIKNNRFYIGSSINFYRRVQDHLRDLIASKHHNYKLQLDFDKYGLECFSWSVIREFDNSFCFRDIISEEYAFIRKFTPYYNISGAAHYQNIYSEPKSKVVGSFNLEAIRQKLIIKALDIKNNNKDAALALGVSERTLYRWIDKYDITAQRMYR